MDRHGARLEHLIEPFEERLAMRGWEHHSYRVPQREIGLEEGPKLTQLFQRVVGWQAKDMTSVAKRPTMAAS